jgi:metal-sulfur cluster biosynthetic enzyme
MTEADLLEALRDCYEPILRRNIVDAGLIKATTLTLDTEAPGANIPGVPQRYIAHVTLLAPGSDEAATAQLAAQIENRLLGMQAISRVTITQLPALFPIL